MSLIQMSTRRRVTVGMMALTAVLFGLIGLSELKVNLLPDLSYPTLTVRTDYAGAAPAEIESLVTEPVEEALGVVKNMRKVRSVSRAGQSDVILEFAWGTDMDLAGLEVREKLEILTLPLEASRPTLLRFDPSTAPVLRMSLTGASEAAFAEAELKQMRRFADEEIKKRLEPVSGVAAVKVGGGLEDEIQIEVDQNRLDQLNMSVGEVIARLRAENVNVSGGRLDEGAQRFLVRTINQFASVEDIGEMLLTTRADAPIRVRDVATVRAGYKEREAIIRDGVKEAVEIAVYKEGDANTVNVAKGVIERLESLKKNLPEGMQLRVVEDQSIFIQQAVGEVVSAALVGGLLAILVIYIFLGEAWSTFIISLSLPISVITTFFLMQQAGLSLNVMSLGGIALATGMLVDNAIVVLENIARKREQGLGILDAAVQGTSEVGMAVTASTLTTVAVFFPLVFVEGIAGQLFRDQALTVTFAMLVSLVVALTFIPMLASLKARSPAQFAEEPPVERKPPRTMVGRGFRGLRDFLFRWIPERVLGLFLWVARWVGKLLGILLRALGWPFMAVYNAAARAYDRALPWALSHRFIVIAISLAMFGYAVTLIPGLGVELIPQLAQGRFDMTVTLPPGTALADTDTLVRAVAAGRKEDGRINGIYAVSGSGTRLDASPTESGENIGKLSIELAPGGGNAVEAEVIRDLRAVMKAHAGAQSKFARPELLSFSTPLEIEISGYDIDRLKKASEEMVARMEGSDRFADVKSSLESGHPEIQILFDQERAAALGLTTREIADQVVRKVRGEVATRYSFRDRKIDVLVRAREQDRASVEDVRNVIVNPLSERPVTLSAVAQVIAAEGPSEIRRIDQERVAVVSANLAYGDLGTAVREVEALLADSSLGAGIQVKIAGQNEEMQASFDSMVFALGLAVFLVYLVMASQFESLLHPFVIMFSIPLALVGAIVALKLTGSTLSVVVFIGLIMLAGIVVNNAIVLIDRINQLRELGSARRDAIMEAARSRLRPIAMTTATTLFGFLPLALGMGEGAEMRQPMAITVIGGLLVSTLLTLLVIPVVYDLMDFGRRRKAQPVAEGTAGAMS